MWDKGTVPCPTKSGTVRQGTVPCLTKSGTVVQDYRVTEYDTANRVKKIQYNVSQDWSGTLGANRTYTYTYRASDGFLTKLVGQGTVPCPAL